MPFPYPTPVVDRTGLTGNFDFAIEFSPEALPGVTHRTPFGNLDSRLRSAQK
jgi:uncharacterized protein (TIGR03435 family)